MLAERRHEVHTPAAMELAQRHDESYFQAWRLVGRHTGGVFEADGVLAAASGLPVAWLNIAFVTRPLERATSALSAAVEFFDARSLPFVVRIREGLDASAESACEQLGMPYSDTIPGMTSARLAAPAAPPSLVIREVVDEQSIDAFCAVIAAGYEMPREMVAAMFARSMFSDPEQRSFVGYCDGAPAACATLVFGGRVAGVHNVATVPGFRRRGFGEAVTWAAIERGAAYGCDLSALQASEMGRPIYERMGFRLTSPYRTFHRAEA